MSELDRVKRYYDEFDELARLETPAGRLEFERKLELIERYVPGGSRVLDLGGGPGRYTVALAERGHSVWLADPSSRQLDFARERIESAGCRDRVGSIDQIDAADLSIYQDEFFHAVVALGPYYHLTESQDRSDAASEIARVLRSGGYAIIAFIPRLSGVQGLIERAAASPDQLGPRALIGALETGAFHNASSSGLLRITR